MKNYPKHILTRIKKITIRQDTNFIGIVTSKSYMMLNVNVKKDSGQSIKDMLVRKGDRELYNESRKTSDRLNRYTNRNYAWNQRDKLTNLHSGHTGKKFWKKMRGNVKSHKFLMTTVTFAMTRISCYQNGKIHI